MHSSSCVKKTFMRMEVVGKRDRLVPLLLSKDLESTMITLEAMS